MTVSGIPEICSSAELRVDNQNPKPGEISCYTFTVTNLGTAPVTKFETQVVLGSGQSKTGTATATIDGIDYTPTIIGIGSDLKFTVNQKIPVGADASLYFCALNSATDGTTVTTKATAIQ
jgi:uncharacterized repeat protein (TIGR01451 family)